MAKQSDLDTTGFSPLELWAVDHLQASPDMLGATAERAADGMLCLTAWSDNHQTSTMLFVVERVDSPAELRALTARCMAHCQARTASDAAELMVTGGLGAAEAKELVEDSFPYLMGLICRSPIDPATHEAYSKDERWGWILRLVHSSELEDGQS